MLGIALGVFVFIQLIVLVFALALCRSAARADKEFERARMADGHHWSHLPVNLESIPERQISPNTKPSRQIISPAHIQNQ